MNAPLSNIILIWLFFLSGILRDPQVPADSRHSGVLQLAEHSFARRAHCEATSVSITLVSKISQVLCFQNSLHVGSVMSITCSCHCLWRLPLSSRKLATSPRFPSPGIFLTPVSYRRTFRVLNCLSFEPGILDSYCCPTYIGIQFHLLSEKSLLFRWSWKSRLEAGFSLCLCERSSSAPRSVSALCRAVCCKDSYELSFVIFVDRWCTGHGVLSIVLTFTLDFDHEPLPRLFLELWTFLVMFLSPFFLACRACSAKRWPHSVPVLPLSPEGDFNSGLRRSFFKHVMNSSEAFQPVRTAALFPKWNSLATFLLPHTTFGDALQIFIEHQLSAKDMDRRINKNQNAPLWRAWSGEGEGRQSNNSNNRSNRKFQLRRGGMQCSGWEPLPGGLDLALTLELRKLVKREGKSIPEKK